MLPNGVFRINLHRVKRKSENKFKLSDDIHMKTRDGRLMKQPKIIYIYVMSIYQILKIQEISKHFRYIKIQPNTINVSTRLWEINHTSSVVISQSLVLRSIVSS